MGICNKAGTLWLTNISFFVSANIYQTLCWYFGPIHQNRQGEDLVLIKDDITNDFFQADFPQARVGRFTGPSFWHMQQETTPPGRYARLSTNCYPPLPELLWYHLCRILAPPAFLVWIHTVLTLSFSVKKEEDKIINCSFYVKHNSMMVFIHIFPSFI